MLAEGNKGIIGSLFMIIIGLICIPKTRQLIEQKFNFRFSKPIKYIAIIFGWFSISILLKPTTSSENSINTLVLSSSEENVTTVSKDTIITSSVSENRNQEIVKKSEKTQSYLPKQKSNKKTEYIYNENFPIESQDKTITSSRSENRNQEIVKKLEKTQS
ncbi:MAG: hypothetical protein IPL35_00785 [Sphingobacteriales bacterium]|nr:hypothetical protein [Sphingobacteriales bacterium]